MNQKGFTAVEMVFVIAVVGVVAAVVAPAITGSSDAAKAQRMMKSASDVESTLKALINEFGGRTFGVGDPQYVGTTLYHEFDIIGTRAASFAVTGDMIKPDVVFFSGSPVPIELANAYRRSELGSIPGIYSNVNEFGSIEIKIIGLDGIKMYVDNDTSFNCAPSSYHTISFYDANGGSKNIFLNVLQKAGSSLLELPTANEGAEVCIKQGDWIYYSESFDGETYSEIYYTFK